MDSDSEDDIPLAQVSCSSACERSSTSMDLKLTGKLNRACSYFIHRCLGQKQITERMNGSRSIAMKRYSLRENP